MNDKKYIFEVLKSAFLMTLVPNILLFLFWKFDTSLTFAPVFTILFNTLILPISLILKLRKINKKHQINLWQLNYIICSICLLVSIFLNLFYWILSIENAGRFYGRHNIDKGTWMVINTEMMIGLGILGVALIYDIIKSIPEKKIKIKE